MSSLIKIDLTENQLEYLDFNIIQGCSKLNKFCLFGNLFPQEEIFNYTGLNSLNQASVWNLNSCF